MVKRPMSSNKPPRKRAKNPPMRLTRPVYGAVARSGTNVTVDVKRTFLFGSWQFGTASTADYWRYIEYTLTSGFQNAAEFAAVFDEYRVNNIRVDFMPRFDNVAAPVTGATPLTVVKPRMACIVDGESTQTPSGPYSAGTLNNMLENGATIHDATKTVTMYCKPSVALATSSGGVVFKKSPWLRTFDLNIQHRIGHVMAFQQGFSSVATDVQWDIFITMYVSFKNLK